MDDRYREGLVVFWIRVCFELLRNVGGGCKVLFGVVSIYLGFCYIWCLRHSWTVACGTLVLNFFAVLAGPFLSFSLGAFHDRCSTSCRKPDMYGNKCFVLTYDGDWKQEGF
jgi:hypothetical protein